MHAEDLAGGYEDWAQRLIYEKQCTSDGVFSWSELAAFLGLPHLEYLFF